MSISYYYRRFSHSAFNFRNRSKHAETLARIEQIVSRRTGEEALNILCVCTGNICRSPYLHYALKQALALSNGDAVTIRSAGIAATPGKRADKKALAIAAERSIDLSPHVSTLIYKEGLAQADIILTMEPEHGQRILKLDPLTADRIIPAGLLGDENDQAIVPDPYGLRDEVFRNSFDILDRVVANIANVVQKRSAAKPL